MATRKPKPKFRLPVIIVGLGFFALLGIGGVMVFTGHNPAAGASLLATLANALSGQMMVLSEGDDEGAPDPDEGDSGETPEEPAPRDSQSGPE